MKLAVISDIHSDLPSLEKALVEIGKSGSERILCLGDIVGYSYHYADYLDGRNPNECVRLVKENCDYVVCGNHDLHAILKLPSNLNQLDIPPNWYELDLAERTRISDNRFWLYDDELDDPLNGDSAAFLADLPEQQVVQNGKFRILATHFIWPDLTGHLKESPADLKDFQDHLKLVRKSKCLVGLAGHAHLEGYAQISRKAFGMNYFRKASLIRRPQVIITPAITRSRARNGYLLLDTGNYSFEAIPID
jgi:predicted phosphodiesterase